MRTVENKTLNELLGIGDAPTPESPVGQRVHAARSRPLDQLEPHELSLLLRQKQGPTYLAPIALRELEKDIWLDAGLYSGDLLLALGRNLGRFGHLTDLESSVRSILAEGVARLGELDEIDRGTVEPELRSLVAEWPA